MAATASRMARFNHSASRVRVASSPSSFWRMVRRITAILEVRARVEPSLILSLAAAWPWRRRAMEASSSPYLRCTASRRSAISFCSAGLSAVSVCKFASSVFRLPRER